MKNTIKHRLKSSMVIVCCSLLTNACVAEKPEADVSSMQKVDYKINDTVATYVNQTTNVAGRETMKHLLEKDFQQRIDEGYTNVGMYKAKLYDVSDIQIVHEDGEKALFLVSSLFKDKPDGMVKLYAGRLSDDTQTWSFNDGGKPSYYYEYRETYRHGVQFTHHELIARTVDKLVADGLLDRSGKVSQDYVATRWF